MFRPLLAEKDLVTSMKNVVHVHRHVYAITVDGVRIGNMIIWTSCYPQLTDYSHTETSVLSHVGDLMADLQQWLFQLLSHDSVAFAGKS
jgi:hypothetical protein